MLVQLLGNMNGLCKEMSDTQVGKNLIFDNMSLLNNLFIRWILLIDDIVRLLKLE